MKMALRCIIRNDTFKIPVWPFKFKSNEEKLKPMGRRWCSKRIVSRNEVEEVGSQETSRNKLNTFKMDLESLSVHPLQKCFLN